MQKLSVLIFSRNDIEKAIGLIKDLYDISDEIVLIDSSDKIQRDELAKKKRYFGLSKLRTYHTVALGYADPLRMYGIEKCKNNWVLYLDTDERISNALKRDVKTIINETTYSAFAIGRQDYAVGETRAFLTWNIRLYEKNKVLYKGILHEQPLVKGKLGKLDAEKYFIKHVPELKNMTEFEYSKMEKFDRLSYRDLNEKSIDYLSKIIMPENRSMKNTHTGKLTTLFLQAYERLKSKKPEEELSRTDYFLFYFLLDMAYLIKRRKLSDAPHLARINLKRAQRLKDYKNAPDSKEILEMSRIINKIGIIKFLDLDKESVIAELNKKYGHEKQGITLLMKLLENQYKTLLSKKHLQST